MKCFNINRNRCHAAFLFLFIVLSCSCANEQNASAKDDILLLSLLGRFRGMYFGAAVGPDYLDEQPYSRTVKLYFNCIVPENHLKWSLIHPANTGAGSDYSFAGADKIIDFAVVNGIAVRGHTLLWHYQLPSWVETASSSELENILRNHIHAVVGRYKGKIFAWDVVNEIIMNTEIGMRNVTKGTGDSDYSIWSQGPSDDALLKKAFQFAHEADPAAKLFLNDNNCYGSIPVYTSWNQLQADKLFEIVSSWRLSGVPIHGVGLQLHLAEDAPPDMAMIENDIVRFGSLGLEVHFTEVDIRVKDATAQKLQHQAEMYRSLISLAKKYPGTVSACLTWGVADNYSWIPGFFPGYGSALLFDAQYNPKSSYTAIADLLR